MYNKTVHVLKSIIETVVFCGKQNLPLRGDRDDRTSTSSNRDDRTSTSSNRDDRTSTSSNRDDRTSTSSNRDDRTSTSSNRDDRTSTSSNRDDRTSTSSNRDDRTSTSSNRDDRTSTSSNRGNFWAVLEMMAKRDDTLREHIETGRKNAQYTSRIILNEVIDVVVEYIRKEHTRSLEDENAFFFIMANEVTDPHGN